MKRTVIITGGTKGLGRELALAFGRDGYCVIAFYATDTVAAENLQVAFTAEKINGAILQHDVTTENPAIWNHPEIQQADHLTLIHNACAPFAPVPMHQLVWNDFENNFTVAVKGGWLCSQALIRLMLKRGGGTMINILTAAIEGLPPKGFGAYAVAKHALRGLTLSLASEYAPRGIRVFSASPGFMNTPLTEQWDARLRTAIQSAAHTTVPSEAARRVLELANDATTPGRGENYSLFTTS